MEASAWVPLDFTPGTFSLCDLALYPFPVINFSREYNSALSPGSPPSKSQEMGVVLGPPTQIPSRILDLSPGAGHTGALSVEKMSGMAVGNVKTPPDILILH